MTYFFVSPSFLPPLRVTDFCCMCPGLWGRMFVIFYSILRARKSRERGKNSHFGQKANAHNNNPPSPSTNPPSRLFPLFPRNFPNFPRFSLIGKN